MSNKIIIIAVLVVAGIAALLFYNPQRADDRAMLPAPEESATPEVSVAIKNFKFLPQTITIAAGDTVTWQNQESGVPHSIVLDNGNYKSAAVFAGESEARRFPVAGTFPYHCGIHPSMKGTVVVE